MITVEPVGDVSWLKTFEVGCIINVHPKRWIATLWTTSALESYSTGRRRNRHTIPVLIPIFRSCYVCCGHGPAFSFFWRPIDVAELRPKTNLAFFNVTEVTLLQSNPMSRPYNGSRPRASISSLSKNLKYKTRKGDPIFLLIIRRTFLYWVHSTGLLTVATVSTNQGWTKPRFLSFFRFLGFLRFFRFFRFFRF